MKAWTKEKAIEQFWKRVYKSLTGCWLWQGKARCGSLNYGAVKLPRALGGPRMEGAHRVAFFLTNGYWPENVRHTCDTPLCCNPAHIIEGTQKQNIEDCIQRNRARNGNLKLNPTIWAAIRASSSSSAVLAKTYGVSDAHIRKIRRGVSGNIYRP